jgi:hypothetical protein
MNKQLALMAALAISYGSLALPAHADDINSRLENQYGRVGKGLSKKKKVNRAQEMKADDKQYAIAAEEQNMKSRHGGKLTKADKRKLNRQLNNNSRRIKNAGGT